MICNVFMQVSGLPIRNDNRHVGEIASMSLDLLDAVKQHKISHRPNETLKLRIGLCEFCALLSLSFSRRNTYYQSV